MQFNITATTGAAGLIQDCEDLLGMTATDISGSSTLMKTFTKNLNEWYRNVNTWIWQSTGTWEYDDSNYSNLPIATTNLVHSQQDYEIPSTAQKVDRVEVLDSNGDYVLVNPIDKSQVDYSMTEYYETDDLPLFYDMVGRSLLLYPAPSSASVTTTAGLKLYFSRGIDAFSYSDTTTSPGFNEDFHRILSLGASYDYALAHDMTERINDLRDRIDQAVDGLKTFYGSRHRDMKTKFTPKRRKYF